MRNNDLTQNVDTERQLKGLCRLGGVMTLFALVGILLDIIVGSITGGNLSALPQTAIDRFVQFRSNTFFGLYNLDLLNIIIQIILIPAYIALYAVQRNVNVGNALLALIVFLFGSVIMVANNTALPMLDLSNKYFATTAESQRASYAAAGESMLAQGAHGSPGVFLGFFIPNIANLIMSILMLKGRIFSRVNSWLGIMGSVLMLIYVVMVNFVSGAENIAIGLAMPGGLLLMTWMIMFTIRLFELSRSTKH
jgi:hypothetical protein